MFKIPVNRVIAFLGPPIAAISAAASAWLVAKVNILSIPGLDKANVATYVAGGLTALIVAGLHALGGLAWFKGHHILLQGATITPGTLTQAEAQKAAGLPVSPTGK